MQENESKISIAKYVSTLAKKHKLEYIENEIDKLAKKFTELSGDEVRDDDTLDLIIVLKRNGVISSKDVVKLASKHLREIKNLKK